MVNRCEKRTLKKSVGGAQGETVYYIQGVREVMRAGAAYMGTQRRDVLPEDVDEMDRGWEGHAMRRMCMREVYFLVRVEVIRSWEESYPSGAGRGECAH